MKLLALSTLLFLGFGCVADVTKMPDEQADAVVFQQEEQEDPLVRVTTPLPHQVVSN